MSSKPDESMELLNAILREPLDPEYAATGADPKARLPVHRLLTFLVCALAGLMFAGFGLNQGKARPEAVDQRDDLITRITQAEETNEGLREQVSELEAEIEQLSSTQTEASSPAGHELEVATGASTVTGDGIVILIHDAPQRAEQGGTVIDQDLRHIVNGLWQSGAEAIAINGHRVTSRTAIRQAGQAITVNYRSLTAPYKIEVIGEQNELAAKFANTDGGALLNSLKQNYGIEWTLEMKNSLTLEADSGLRTERAQPK